MRRPGRGPCVCTSRRVTAVLRLPAWTASPATGQSLGVAAWDHNPDATTYLEGEAVSLTTGRNRAACLRWRSRGSEFHGAAEPAFGSMERSRPRRPLPEQPPPLDGHCHVGRPRPHVPSGRGTERAWALRVARGVLHLEPDPRIAEGLSRQLAL